MRRLSPTFIASLVLLNLSLLPFAHAQNVNRWTGGAALTVARAQACAAVLSDGRLMVAGGLGDSGPVAVVDIYGQDGAFHPASPMGQARARAACVTLPDGRVLVTGGDNGNSSLDSAEIFDPAGNRWQPVGNLSVAREGHQMSVNSWGDVWVAGGFSNGAIAASLELFTPGAGQFRAAGRLNTPRAEFAMTSVGRSLVIAGGTDGKNVLSSVEIYDGSLGAVSIAGSMIEARKDFAVAALLDGTVLITGGIDRAGAALASTEIFDLMAGISIAGPGLLEARAYHSAYAMKNNGSVLIYGGKANSTVLGTTEIYTPWTGGIAQGAALNNPRFGEAKAALRPGSYLVAGGRGVQGLLSGSEFFQFSTIGTDKPDYAPGTSVKISGTGWTPGEQVLVTIAAFPIDQHRIEFTGAAVADGAGNISVPGFAVDKSHLGLKFLMTATGSQSQAQSVFTDGIDPTISYTFVRVSARQVDVTVTMTPNPAITGPTPTGLIIPCAPSSTCPASLTVAVDPGYTCSPTLVCNLVPTGVNNTSAVAFTLTVPSGATAFSVDYSGDSNYNPEAPTSAVTPPGAPIVTYNAPNFTTTDLTGGPPAPASYGTQIPYIANICPSNDASGPCDIAVTLSGTVQFSVNSIPYGSPVPVSGSTNGIGAAVPVAFIPNPPLPVGGPYVITAVYSGDSSNFGSSGTAANGGAASISTTIQKDPTTTTLAVTQDADPTSATQSGRVITLTATTHTSAGIPTVPGGSFTFLLAAGAFTSMQSNCGTGSGVQFTTVGTSAPGLAIATCTFTITGPLGTGVYGATYNGDANTSASTAAGQTITLVGQSSSTPGSGIVSSSVILRAMPSPAPWKSPVVLSANVLGLNGRGEPTGSVTFTDNNVVLGIAPLINQIATLTIVLSPGAHNIGASYSGDIIFPSSFANIGVTVLQPAPTITFSSNPVASVFGQAVTMMVKLTGPQGVSAVPTGVIQFLVNGMPAGSPVTVVNGVGTLSLNNLPVGNDNISITYSGDSYFVGIASNVGMVTVSPATISLVNAASYASTFAPGEIVTAFGVLLAPQTVNSVLPLGTSLGGDTVTVTDSLGISRDALMFYVSPTQLSFLIPPATATGAATVAVNTANGSIQTTIPIMTSTAGIFTANADGKGPLAAQAVSETSSFQSQYTNTASLSGAIFINTPISFTRPQDSLYLLLYGTGFDNAKTVSVTINGRVFMPSYFGPQGIYAGLDQVNVLLPADLAGTGSVNVSITVDGQISNLGTITFQ